jgi:hypothetical protein
MGAICKWCGQDMMEASRCTHNDAVEYPDGTRLDTMPAEKKCHDCNVDAGQKHHPDCDMERCPQCDGQLISCGCLEGDA